MSRTVNDAVVMGTHPLAAGVPLGDWHLAHALARRRRVLWVDPPASPLAPRRGVASTTMFRRRPVPVADGLVMASPIVHSGRARPAHAGAVDALLAAQVRRWMRLLAMREVDLISFSPRSGALAGIPRRTLTLWLKDRDWAANGAPHAGWLQTRMEDAARAADVVVGVSDALVADCLAVGVAARRIPNGCDVAHYARPRREPDALAALGRPRVVFSGAWNWRVDTDLVAAAAAALPEFSFVVVGAVDGPLPMSANVHSVGAVPYDDLPAHLQFADVGIVPYRRGTFNDASCPLKVYEYLAAGLPVVSTGVGTDGLPEELVRPVDGAAEFVTAIRELAGRDVRLECRTEAANHSWELRADALLEAIDLSASGTLLARSGR